MKKHITRRVLGEHVTYIGLDVHKKSISVAMLRSDSYEPVTWEMANGPQAGRRLLRELSRRTDEPVRVCYEAGPCGYSLQRELRELDVECAVVAPSLIPRKPGDRVKTDRRDACKLAELFRAGVLTEVYAPTLDQEAARGLSRCREDAVRDLKSARHRLGKFLDMRGLRWEAGKSHWTGAHHRWLNSLRFEQEQDQFVFDHYLSKVQVCAEQRSNVTKAFEALALEAPYAEPVGFLRCFHGIDTVTALVHAVFDTIALIGENVGADEHDSDGYQHNNGGILNNSLFHLNTPCIAALISRYLFNADSARALTTLASNFRLLLNRA